MITFYKKSIPSILSKLWLILTLNYLFCDLFSLFLSKNLTQLLNGGIGEITFTEQFLLFFSVIMEIPIIMVFFSSILKYRLNRIVNIIAGSLMLFIQIGSLVSGKNNIHYIFFSIIEIILLIIIIRLAIVWKQNT